MPEAEFSFVVKVNSVETLAFTVSVAVTFMLYVPDVSGMPENVFVSELKSNHDGKGIPLLNNAEYRSAHSHFFGRDSGGIIPLTR